MMSLYAMRCSPYRPTQMVMVSLDMLNGNVILMEFLALAAPDVVLLTTASAARHDNFIKMTKFPFQCSGRNRCFISSSKLTNAGLGINS